jgi:hypothetical protein
VKPDEISGKSTLALNMEKAIKKRNSAVFLVIFGLLSAAFMILAASQGLLLGAVLSGAGALACLFMYKQLVKGR